VCAIYVLGMQQQKMRAAWHQGTSCQKINEQQHDGATRRTLNSRACEAESSMGDSTASTASRIANVPRIPAITLSGGQSAQRPKVDGKKTASRCHACPRLFLREECKWQAGS
jgi:hypothetical protein